MHLLVPIMLVLGILLLVLVILNIQYSKESCKEFELVSRDGWHAKPPEYTQDMPTPVPYVIIHHSFIPPACHSESECIKSMLSMQTMHQDHNHWADIGYNFAVGGDARAYTGRGWTHVGAHAPSYNNRSIGICVIGDWRKEIPPVEQLATVKNLINCGVELGYIREDYTLLGHRQVRDTECPGNALFEEIQTWSHWSPTPERKIITEPNCENEILS